MQCCSEGRAIVYSDESYLMSTYTNSSHVNLKEWSDDSNAGIASPINKEKSLICLHAGGEMDFFNDCLVLWQANTT